MEHLLQSAGDITTEVEILVTIGIGIEEDRTRRPTVDTGRIGNLLEGAVTPIPVERVRTEIGDQ